MDPTAVCVRTAGVTERRALPVGNVETRSHEQTHITGCAVDLMRCAPQLVRCRALGQFNARPTTTTWAARSNAALVAPPHSDSVVTLIMRRTLAIGFAFRPVGVVIIVVLCVAIVVQARHFVVQPL